MRRNPLAQCPKKADNACPFLMNHRTHQNRPLNAEKSTSLNEENCSDTIYVCNLNEITQSHTYLTSHEWTLSSLYSRPLVRWYTRTEPLLVPIKTTGEMSANLAGESVPPKSFVKFTFYKRIQTIYLKNK